MTIEPASALKPRRRALAFVSAALLFVLFGGAPTTAEDPIHPELREFFRTGKYALYISGTEQAKARFFHSRRAGAFLILGSDFGQALLIRPRAKTVTALSPDDVAERPDGGMDVVAKAELQELGAIRLERRDVLINVEGLTARLQPRKYLLGLKEAADLTLHTPEYERKGKPYRLRPSETKRLKSEKRDVKVRVFFGSWCHTCTRLLPRIIKVDQVLADSNIEFDYYGLPKVPAMGRDPQARKHRIKRIPTALVYVDGKLIGRISSTGLSCPEAAICNLLTRGH